MATIEFDGVYRPERGIGDGTWMAVAYVRGDRGTVTRTPTGTRRRGLFKADIFESKAAAQKVCDRMNKTGKSGAAR